MPRAKIVITDRLTHPGVPAVIPCDRIVVTERTDRERWSNARVIVADGCVLDRRDGIAVLALRGVTPDEAVEALAGVPDPVVLVVHEGRPDPALVEAVKARGHGGGEGHGPMCELVEAGPGGLALVHAINKPGVTLLHVERLRKPRRPRKPTTD